MKNRNTALTAFLAAVGLGAVFTGICLATGNCQNQSNTVPVSTQVSAAQGSTEKVDAKKELKWHTSLDSAMTESAVSDKLILADFHATWCPPCKMMDEKTFTDAAFIEEAENWVLLKIDTDKDPETAIKYGVQGLPTLGVLRSDGKPVAGSDGYHSARELLTFMQAAKNQAEAEQGNTKQDEPQQDAAEHAGAE